MDSSSRLFLVGSGGLAVVLALRVIKAQYSPQTTCRVNGSEDFEAASQFFGNNAHKFPADLQLRLYGLFKQVTSGDAPAGLHKNAGLLDSKRRLMNDAWISNRGMLRQDADRVYIQLIEECCPDFRDSREYRSLKSEEEPKSEASGWAVGSMPRDLVGNHDTDDSMIGQLCELVVDGNIQSVSDVTARDPAYLNKKDKDGMTCLHWASDRGHRDLVKLLLDRNSDPNIQDSLGNTALHMACQTGQEEIVYLLLESKADVSLCNEDGESAASLLTSEFPHFSID